MTSTRNLAASVLTELRRRQQRTSDWIAWVHSLVEAQAPIVTVAELRRGDLAHVLTIAEANTQASAVLNLSKTTVSGELYQVALDTGTRMLPGDSLALVGTASRTLDEIEPGDEVWTSTPGGEPAFWRADFPSTIDPGWLVVSRPDVGQIVAEPGDGGRFEVRIRLDLDPRVTSSNELRARAQRAGVAARHLLDPRPDATPEEVAATVEAGAAEATS